MGSTAHRTSHARSDATADEPDRPDATSPAPSPVPSTAPSEVRIRGLAIDAETRCEHYGSALDVVALRAPCCGAWYPCHLCHAAVADHPLQVIPRAEHGLPAALCGVCRCTMTVPEYLAADACPWCSAPFNPGCAAHAHLYFAP